ncbi:MAG: aminoglycoside phosphotransferase family protein [Alphaproteobacteria bacterium]
MNREETIKNFIKNNNLSDAQMNILAADASFRKYFRLTKKDFTVVLMDAPPPQEDIKPFVNIAKHLKGLGLNAPEIIAEDEKNGLILLEDFGDDTYTKLLAKGENEKDLYRLAVDVLIELNKRPTKEATPENIPSYDDDRFINEALLLTDWYMPALFKKPVTESVREEYIALWKDALKKVRAIPESLVLRDYHVDNLMKVKNANGLKSCGLLDFQDGLKGPMIYDLMSLMEDARRDIDQNLISEMKARYLSAFDGQNDSTFIDLDDFDAAWAILGAVRHSKVIGIFTRLCVRDGKPNYLNHIPRVWKLLENSLEHSALYQLKQWFNRNIPINLRKIPNVRNPQ